MRAARKDREGEIKLLRQFIPLPALSTPTHPLNRLEKLLLRLLTPFSLEAEHNAVNLVWLSSPVFDWAAAYGDYVFRLKRHFRLTSMGLVSVWFKTIVLVFLHGEWLCLAFNIRFAVHLYSKSLPLLNRVMIEQCIRFISNNRFARHLANAARLMKNGCFLIHNPSF